MFTQKITPPLILTLIRLVGSPLLLAPLIALQAPSILTLVVFIIIALTDWADGYTARLWNQTTSSGAFLDQFSDKVFLFSCLIALTATAQLSWWVSLLLIIRELFVMGLREYGLQQGISLPVIFLAKVKTALQMIFIGALLINMPVYVNMILLVGVLISGYYSAFLYARTFMKA